MQMPPLELRHTSHSLINIHMHLAMLVKHFTIHVTLFPSRVILVAHKLLCTILHISFLNCSKLENMISSNSYNSKIGHI